MLSKNKKNARFFADDRADLSRETCGRERHIGGECVQAFGSGFATEMLARLPHSSDAGNQAAGSFTVERI